jgi:hypothetical protein
LKLDRNVTRRELAKDHPNSAYSGDLSSANAIRGVHVLKHRFNKTVVPALPGDAGAPLQGRERAVRDAWSATCRPKKFPLLAALSDDSTRLSKIIAASDHGDEHPVTT